MGGSVREITKEMISVFNIMEIGYDFMGYTFSCPSELSFHHLIIPRKDCKGLGIGTGYVMWNGAILKMVTSHQYLHIIERLDREKFLDITSEMIDENLHRQITIKNLRRIRDILLSFEREHSATTNSRGELVIKEEYIRNRIKL